MRLFRVSAIDGAGAGLRLPLSGHARARKCRKITAFRRVSHESGFAHVLSLTSTSLTLDDVSSYMGPHKPSADQLMYRSLSRRRRISCSKQGRLYLKAALILPLARYRS
jgi:hypothetical protein